MLTALVCPISTEKVDSYLSRITIFLNVILMVAFTVTLNPVYISIVAIDYCIRAFLNNKLSPIRFLAVIIRKLIKVPPKYIDLAPKLFAARLGFILSLAAFILSVTNNALSAMGMTYFLMALSTLDSVFNFCLGCFIYNYFVFPFFTKRNNSTSA